MPLYIERCLNEGFIGSMRIIGSVSMEMKMPHLQRKETFKADEAAKVIPRVKF
jgi:hypothetical protein